jgi:hypothetical protein
MAYLNSSQFEAVSEALSLIYVDDNGDGYVSAEGMEKIRAAIAMMQEAKDNEAPADLLALARDEHCNTDDVEIDDSGAGMALGDDGGAWVQAWVYVSDWEPAENYCGQCEGSGTIRGGLNGNGDDEQCPVCGGFGKIADMVTPARIPADLAESCEGFTCKGCGRPEAVCSSSPCQSVIADRKALMAE